MWPSRSTAGEPSVGVATTRKFIRDKPDVVRRYVKSQVEAVHVLKSDRETSIKVVAKYLKLKDRELLEKSYDVSAGEDVYPRKQYPTLAGIKTILDALAAENPKAKEVKPEDLKTEPAKPGAAVATRTVLRRDPW